MGARQVAVGRTPQIALARDKVRAAIRTRPTDVVLESLPLTGRR